MHEQFENFENSLKHITVDELNAALKVITDVYPDLDEAEEEVLVLSKFIIQEWMKSGRIEFTEEEFEKELERYIVDFVLEKLCEKGLVEVMVGDNGEFLYKRAKK